MRDLRRRKQIDFDTLPTDFALNLEDGRISVCNCVDHAIAYSIANNRRIGHYAFVPCQFVSGKYFAMPDTIPTHKRLIQ